jgi:ribokinase
MFLALEGEATLGRNESRPARMLDARDYCKLHIIAHHVAVLLGAAPSGTPFHVVPIGRVGADETGRRLVAEMAAVGMDTTYVGQVAERPTLFSVCFQYSDGSGGNITTSDSAASALSAEDLEPVAPLIGEQTAVLAAPEADVSVRRRLLELGSARGALRVAAFTSTEVEEARASGMLGMVDLLSLNEDEAAVLAGRARDPDRPDAYLEALAGSLGAADAGLRILVTAGNRGAFAFENGRWSHRRAPVVRAVNTAGAGDALLGGVVAAVAAGVPLTAATTDATEGTVLRSALDLGVLLAGYSVTSPHTIHPSADLGSLLAFAAEQGLTFAPPLGDVV